uniref:BACK domain-containing protein n=1 Tax=Timema shepardi TaxID=629360 RepID=A0A7R9B3B5_TIMSH|nr:unnamed protein product [Timema shepardi]
MSSELYRTPGKPQHVVHHFPQHASSNCLLHTLYIKMTIEKWELIGKFSNNSQKHNTHFHHHATVGTARATVLYLPGSPTFLPTPSYVRMRTTVKHHVAGTAHQLSPTFATSDRCLSPSNGMHVLAATHPLSWLGQLRLTEARAKSEPQTPNENTVANLTWQTSAPGMFQLSLASTRTSAFVPERCSLPFLCSMCLPSFPPFTENLFVYNNRCNFIGLLIVSLDLPVEPSLVATRTCLDVLPNESMANRLAPIVLSKILSWCFLVVAPRRRPSWVAKSLRGHLCECGALQVHTWTVDVLTRSSVDSWTEHLHEVSTGKIRATLRVTVAIPKGDSLNYPGDAGSHIGRANYSRKEPENVGVRSFSLPMNYRPRTDCPNSDGTRDFLPLPAECSLSGVPSHGDPWATSGWFTRMSARSLSLSSVLESPFTQFNSYSNIKTAEKTRGTSNLEEKPETNPIKRSVSFNLEEQSSFLQDKSIGDNNVVKILPLSPSNLTRRDGEPVDKYEDFSLRSNSELSKEGHRKQKKKSRASKKNAMDLESFGYTLNKPVDFTNLILPSKVSLKEKILNRVLNCVHPDCLVCVGDVEFGFQYSSIVLFHRQLTAPEKSCSYFKHTINTGLMGLDTTARRVYCACPSPATFLKYSRESNTPRHNVQCNVEWCDQAYINATNLSAFATVYEWMLSNQDSYKHLNKNNVFDMFLASQYLEIRELEDQCWCLMSMEDVCRGDVALKLFLKAMRKEIKEIADVMLPRIGEFFLPFVGKRKFLDLPLEELMILLCSDHLSVRCEMEVFMCGVRWLMHDWERRKKHALELMRCVRFGLITPWQLVDINRNPSNPEFLRVTSIPEVRALIEDGLSYSVMRQQRSEDPVVEQGITRLAFDVSHQRNWLPDPTDGGHEDKYVSLVLSCLQVTGFEFRLRDVLMFMTPALDYRLVYDFALSLWTFVELNL